VIELINLLLLVAAVALSLEIVYLLASQRGFSRGRRQGWEDCLKLGSELADAKAEQEVKEQREVIKRWTEICAEEEPVEREAAEVAPWN